MTMPAAHEQRLGSTSAQGAQAAIYAHHAGEVPIHAHKQHCVLPMCTCLTVRCCTVISICMI